MTEDKIQFFVPDFYERFHLILLLHELMEQNPDYFYDNVTIEAAYGTFPGAIWNGGRVVLGSATKQEIQYVISELNNRGIAVRYTFTNPLIEEKHLNDTYCNLCMELGNNGLNEVLVNSPVLEEYIRKNYSGYKIMSSTTKCLRTKEEVMNELAQDYDLVVLDSAFNNTDELFELPHKEKIELLVNHYCMDDCPRRQEHYNAVGRCQLNYSEVDFPPCPNINRDFYEIKENRSFITTEALYGKYKNAGFRNFKIDGRAFNKFKVLESYIYFFVKEEYRDEVRLSILRHMDQL